MANLSRLLKEIGGDAFSAWKQLPSVGTSASKADIYEAIKQIAENDPVGVLGIRSVPTGETLHLMGKVRPSKVWAERGGDFYPTRFNAEGPSAVSIDAVPTYARDGSTALDVSEMYPGNKYLLRSENTIPLSAWNVDRGEIVMDRPRVLAGFAPQQDGSWQRILGLAGGGLVSGSVLGADDAQAAPYSHADANNLDRTIERLSKSMPLNDMASGMIPRATQASVQPINNMGAWQQMEQQGRVTPDLPVPEAEWSPVDLATAPIGAAGKVGKLAAMALDAPINLAVNRLIDALSAGANTASNWWNGK